MVENDLGDQIASNTKVILPLTTNTLDMSLHKIQIAPLLVFNSTRWSFKSSAFHYYQIILES